MLKVELRRQNTYLQQTWKNGKGESWEIARDSQEPYAWRVSLAKLTQSGPFSLFEGYDRVTTLLEGGPGQLLSAGKSHSFQELKPVRFSGDDQTSVVLVAPGRDFNLFCFRDRAKGNIYPSYLSEKEEVQFPIVGNEHFVFCVSGSVLWKERDSEREISLMPNDCLWFSRESKKKEYLNQKLIGKSARSCVLWVVIHKL
jgi:environmental stress-induced protein Ves